MKIAVDIISKMILVLFGLRIHFREYYKNKNLKADDLYKTRQILDK